MDVNCRGVGGVDVRCRGEGVCRCEEGRMWVDVKCRGVGVGGCEVQRCTGAQNSKKR